MEIPSGGDGKMVLTSHVLIIVIHFSPGGRKDATMCGDWELAVKRHCGH